MTTMQPTCWQFGARPLSDGSAAEARAFGGRHDTWGLLSLAAAYEGVDYEQSLEESDTYELDEEDEGPRFDENDLKRLKVCPRKRSAPSTSRLPERRFRISHSPCEGLQHARFHTFLCAYWPLATYLQVPDLKQLCDSYGVSKTGKKSELIERLLQAQADELGMTVAVQPSRGALIPFRPPRHLAQNLTVLGQVPLCLCTPCLHEPSSCASHAASSLRPDRLRCCRRWGW